MGAPFPPPAPLQAHMHTNAHAHPHPRATSQTSKGFLRFQEEQLEDLVHRVKAKVHSIVHGASGYLSFLLSSLTTRTSLLPAGQQVQQPHASPPAPLSGIQTQLQSPSWWISWVCLNNCPGQGTCCCGSTSQSPSPGVALSTPHRAAGFAVHDLPECSDQCESSLDPQRCRPTSSAAGTPEVFAGMHREQATPRLQALSQNSTSTRSEVINFYSIEFFLGWLSLDTFAGQI